MLQELARIGFAKVTDVINTKTAEIRKDATEDDLACIQSVKIKPSEWGTEREIKMYDKKSALELLGKHLGMYQNNINVTVETSNKLDDILSQMGGEGLEE